MTKFMNWKAGRYATILIVGASLAACSSTPGDPGTSSPATITSLPRALTATEAIIRDAANDFSFALAASVNDSLLTSNTFISPLSASFALGMTMNGAANQTFTEMRSALQLRTLSQEEINNGYNTLLNLLVGLDPSVKFQIANSIWYRNTFPVRATFVDTTKKYFYASVQPLNFSDRSASLELINNWVYASTNGKITKVLDTITDDQVMFLLNAIYFKGSWREKFDAALTAQSQFTTASGATQPVQLMHRTASMSYKETATYQAIDLPYGNSAFAMTVVLPKAGYDVNLVSRSFTSTSWQALTSSMGSTMVDLALPKIKLSYERQLNADLKALGMLAAFTNAADFSKLSTQSVQISFVKQNSFVDINEEGTEAAAVTTVGVTTTSAPLSVTMRVDRPYLFFIRERLSGTVIFMGKITGVPQ
ncbi:MAG: serpin family protein [Gemmatimonadaceae bacterium]